MPPGDIDAVALRRVLEQFDVAEQARARVAAFDQVVAEDPVLREAAAHRQIEGIPHALAASETRVAGKRRSDERLGFTEGQDEPLIRQVAQDLAQALKTILS